MYCSFIVILIKIPKKNRKEKLSGYVRKKALAKNNECILFHVFYRVEHLKKIDNYHLYIYFHHNFGKGPVADMRRRQRSRSWGSGRHSNPGIPP